MINIFKNSIIVIVFFLSSNISIAQEYDYSTAEELGLMQGFPPEGEKIVDKSNALMSAPYNRYSYLNMRMFYPTAAIDNAKLAIPIEVKIDTAISGLKIEKANNDGLPSGTKVDMETYLKETFTDALVVIHGDKIVYEHYDNGMDANHPHQMMSVTKSFAGLFGLMIVEAGKAREEEKVSRYIEELKESSAFGDATFGQVLDMTNSMDFSEDYDDPESGIQHYVVVLGLMEPQEGKTYTNSIYEYLPTLTQDKAHLHGEVFHYQTPKADVVNWVTNRVTGKSFQENMYDMLWSKLGTDGETYVLLDKNATLFAGGGLNATPRDLSRFAMMMLNDGEFNGKQVVSPTVINKLAKGGSTKAFANDTSSSDEMNAKSWSYRAQWWVRHDLGKQAFTAIGIHGQWIYIDIEHNTAIIKQSSQPVSDSEYFDSYNLNAYDLIIEHLSAD